MATESELFLKQPPRIMGLDKVLETQQRQQNNSSNPFLEDFRNFHNDTKGNIIKIESNLKDILHNTNAIKVETNMTNKLLMSMFKKQKIVDDIEFKHRRIVENYYKKLLELELAQDRRERNKRDSEKKESKLSKDTKGLGGKILQGLLETVLPGLGRAGVTNWIIKSVGTLFKGIFGFIAGSLGLGSLFGKVRGISIPKGKGIGELFKNIFKTSAKNTTTLKSLDFSKNLGNLFKGINIKGIGNFFKSFKSQNISNVTKFFGNLFSKAKTIPVDVISPAGKVVGQSTAKVGGSILGEGLSVLGKGFKTVTGSLGKTFTKGIGKNVIKKIPLVGTLISLGFAIDRWNKGDKLGAFIELSSGVASAFPGLGTLVAIGLDILNFARDFNIKENPETNEPVRKEGAKTGIVKNLFNWIKPKSIEVNPITGNYTSPVGGNKGEKLQSTWNDRPINTTSGAITGTKSKSLVTAMKSLNLKGTIADINSKPYIATENVGRLKQLDEQLANWGYKTIYTSAMGGHKTGGHVKGNKVDIQLTRDGKMVQMTPEQLAELKKMGFFGGSTGALGWEEKKEGQNFGHYDLSIASSKTAGVIEAIGQGLTKTGQAITTKIKDVTGIDLTSVKGFIDSLEPYKAQLKTPNASKTYVDPKLQGYQGIKIEGGSQSTYKTQMEREAEARAYNKAHPNKPVDILSPTPEQTQRMLPRQKVEGNIFGMNSNGSISAGNIDLTMLEFMQMMLQG